MSNTVPRYTCQGCLRENPIYYEKCIECGTTQPPSGMPGAAPRPRRTATETPPEHR